MLADFVIEVEDARKPLAVQVRVHDNVASLRRAANAYDKRYGPTRKKKQTQNEFFDTLGVCHRFHTYSQPLCALVRLAPPNLGAGIVAHELAHAAVWMWEIHHKFNPKKALNCGNDEWFCWVLGELVRQTTDQLYSKGVYK